jgi:hypothetical protein
MMRFRFPEGDALHRMSACGVCLQDIGNQAYCIVYTHIAHPLPVPRELKDIMEPVTGFRETVHADCVRDDQDVLSSHDAIDGDGEDEKARFRESVDQATETADAAYQAGFTRIEAAHEGVLAGAKFMGMSPEDWARAYERFQEEA